MGLLGEVLPRAEEETGNRAFVSGDREEQCTDKKKILHHRANLPDPSLVTILLRGIQFASFVRFSIYMTSPRGAPTLSLLSNLKPLVNIGRSLSPVPPSEHHLLFEARLSRVWCGTEERRTARRKEERGAPSTDSYFHLLRQRTEHLRKKCFYLENLFNK